MNRLPFLLFCAVPVVIGCGGGGAHSRSRADALVHGPNTWADAERKIRYAENVPVYREKAESAIVTQKGRAPVESGEAVAASPLTVEGVARSLLGDIKTAKPLAEGELTYENMVKLENPARGILLHTRELVTIFDRRSVKARIVAEFGRGPQAGESASEDDAAELAALDEWMAVATRIERSAKWLLMGALTKAPADVQKGWLAVLESGRKLPQIRAGIDMMALKKKRRR